MKNSEQNKKFQKNFNLADGIKIENLVYFPKKREFLIARGGRMRLVKVEENGKLLVNIENFDNYFLDIKTFEIFSFLRGKKHLILPLKNRAQKTYQLYRNGIAHEVTFWSIMRDNFKKIEAKFL